jgi:signal transduction histidine kinase
MQPTRLTLVAGEDASAARVLQLLGGLGRSHFELRRAATLEQALAADGAASDDVFLICCGLEEHVHLEGVQRAVERGNEAAFILLTAGVDSDHGRRARQAGASDSMPLADLTPGRLRRSIRRGANERRLEIHRIAHVRDQIARARAEWLHRAKDEFLATLAHELRTPLNAMLGWGQLLRDGGLDAATASRGLEAIVRSGQAQALIIEQLIDVTHLLDGTLTLAKRPVALGALVVAVCEELRGAAARGSVELRCAVDTTAPPLLGDPARLQQVVRGLVGNALKFTPRGGFVDVVVGVRDGQARLTVLDSGSGIASELLPRLFDRFRRGAPATTRAHGGLGIGLAIVHHLVGLHAGTITASSDGPDKGSTFTVSLPLTPVDAAEAWVPSAPERPALHVLAGLRLLVVEDDPASRDYLCSTLTLHGAAAVPAESAARAWALLHAERFDAVLSDIAMPHEDGLSLIRRMRADDDPQVRRMPAAALSAHAGTDAHDDAVVAGFQLHLAKPIGPRELLAVIAELLAAS